MGRLSDYINSGGSGGSFSSDTIEISGLVENADMIGRLLTYDQEFAKNYRKLIRDVLKTARKNLSKDIGNSMPDDPRKAARAVKFAVYKQMFGGNLSILQKRKAGARYELIRQKKLQPGQRGGNRRPKSDRTKQLESYYGADRGFVLRFLNAGTEERSTRYGMRGHIRQRGIFAYIAPYHIENAAEIVADAVTEYINQIQNGKN